MIVNGRFTGDYSFTRSGFVYEYICGRCHRVFLETCPDVEEPVLCAECFTGQRQRIQTRKERQKARELAKTVHRGAS